MKNVKSGYRYLNISLYHSYNAIFLLDLDMTFFSDDN